MRRFATRWVVLVLLSIAGALGLASCDGGTKPKPAPHLVRVVNGHPCDPNHYFMQCALTPPSKNAKLRPGATIFAHGVDFAWGGPRSCAQMRNLGAAFGQSYLSYDTGKNWTRSLIATFHACGIATGYVWETTASRAGQGCKAGHDDASAAVALLRNLGVTSPTQPFTMAIDFDASGPQVAPYFQCASQTAPGRVNAYGGAAPITWLCAHGLVGHYNWPTYAWLYRNGGQWPPASCGPLQQYFNDGTVDYDRAIAANYGQDPQPRQPVRCFGPNRHHGPVCGPPIREVASRNAQILRVRRALLTQGCRVAVFDRPAPAPPSFRRGPNYNSAACKHLFAVGTTDHQRIAKLEAATYR